DGAEVRVRPDVPPDLLDGPDRPRAQQDVHVLLELRPVRQAWRRPGRRQRAEGHGPARGETRVIAAPERARRGKREEVRQICGKRVDDWYRLRAVMYSHMYMHAEGLNPASKPLHLIDKLRIALDGRHRRIAPVAHRVGSGACEHNTVRGGDALAFGDHFGQVVLGSGHRAANAGDDLDRGLHELVPQPRMLAGIPDDRQLAEDLSGFLPELHGLAVDQLHFPLDAERGTVRGIPVDGHAVSIPTRGSRPPDPLGLVGPVLTPHVTQRVTRLAKRGSGAQRVSYRVEHVVAFILRAFFQNGQGSTDRYVISGRSQVA